jgi:hypothetical protein
MAKERFVLAPANWVSMLFLCWVGRLISLAQNNDPSSLHFSLRKPQTAKRAADTLGDAWKKEKESSTR